MTTVVIEEDVRIPSWVTDHASFRRWARSADFPERGWFSYLNGELWVDLGMERFAHNQLKGEFAVVVGGLVKAEQSGRWFHDRMMLTHSAAGLSTEPDGMFVSKEALRAGLVKLAEGAESLEVEGSPDVVLEVVSRKSVKKDRTILRKLYWLAGIGEYWLVDPLAATLRFDIFRRGEKGFVASRKQEGWVRSAAFGKSFRLSVQTDEGGLPQFILQVK